MRQRQRSDLQRGSPDHSGGPVHPGPGAGILCSRQCKITLSADFSAADLTPKEVPHESRSVYAPPANSYDSIQNDPYRKAYALAVQLEVAFNISSWCFNADSPSIAYASTNDHKEELLAFLNISGGLDYAYANRGERRPIFMNDPFGMAWVCEWFYDDPEPSFLIVLGPVLTTAATAPNLMFRLREKQISPSLCDSLLDIMSKLPIMNPSYLVNIGLMLHVTLTNEAIKPADCLYQGTQVEEPQMLPDFAQANDSRVLEEYLMRVVREGNVPALDQIQKVTASSRMYELELSRDLRTMKNTFIVLNALCSREAISAGLPPRTALSVELHYSSAIEAAVSAVDLLRILLTFAEDYTTRVRKVKYDERYSKPIRDCCAYIQAHLTEELTLEQIASNIGYAEYYLTKKFHRETGIRLNEYIKQQRIELAKLLLRTTNTTVQEISDMLCFGTRNFFSSVFKSMVGVSPAAYRDGNFKEDANETSER